MQKSTAISRIVTTDDLEAVVVSLETEIHGPGAKHNRNQRNQASKLYRTQKVLKTRSRPVPPLHGEQRIVHTNRDKAEAFDSLELQCRENQFDDEDEEHTALLGDPTPQRDIIVKRNTDWANFRAEMQRSTAIPRIETTDDLETAVSPAFRCTRTPEDLNPRDNSLWKTQKALKTKRRPVPPLHGEQGIVHTNRDKAEAFADSLELQCRENQLDDEDKEHTALNDDKPADDTVLAAQSAEAAMAGRYLQRATDELEEWCNRWKIAINADKSTGIIFTRRPTQRRAQEVTINGEDRANNVKYLRVHLDRTMTWGHHVAETIRKAKIARARLYPLLCGESRLSLRNKLLLIKSIIQPQLTYASTAWGHACKSHLKKIQAVENIALRTAVSAPWFVRNRDLHRDLEWTPVQEVIKAKAAKVYAKATDHENLL
ncbi:hypothetical protein NQ315_012485 [Exocentrus adspersus]|uniref:RNA-directed DNA polymerase from transposon X-element n=1 Tax=Exocentrus adspersus TaxID=1586481 RepID=A0AAV8VBF2_9CUCU|nr:hypothetical protein NQ315_012485 [Exocentrus adspersus]